MRKNDNRGLSLVELLVAFAVSTIVIAGVSSLIFSSLKLYGINNANVEIQNESQVALNLVIDNIMEASGVCMSIPDGNADTECILLGDLVIQEDRNEADMFEALFAGAAIVFIKSEDPDVSGDPGEPVKEMYLLEMQKVDGIPLAVGDPNYSDYCRLVYEMGSKEEAASEALKYVRRFVRDMSEGERLYWLMGKYVSSCVIRPADEAGAFFSETTEYVNINYPSEVKDYFVEPFTLHVKLGFEYEQQTRIITRTMEDDIAVRSRLKEIYVEDSGGMKRYERW